MAGTGSVSDCSCKSGPCEGSIVSMSVVMLSISYSTADCKLAADKDLRDQNVVLLQSTVLREMLDITTDI